MQIINDRKMKKLICLLLVLGVLISCQDQRKAKNWNDKTLADDEAINFIKKGIEGGLIEVKLASLAKTRSSNPRVINFANMMIADHTKIGKELKQIQLDKLIDEKDTISTEKQTMIDELAAKSSSAFDKAYMGMMVNDHKEDIELFKSVGSNTSATMQKMAEKTLPTLQMHLDSAMAINASLK